MIVHKEVAVPGVAEPVAGKAGALEWNAEHKAPYGLIMSATEFGGSAYSTWPQMPATEVPYKISDLDPDMLAWVGAKIMFTWIKQVRIIANVQVVGAAGAVMFLGVSFFNVATELNEGRAAGSDVGVRQPQISLATTGLKDSGWVNVDAAIRAFDPNHPLVPNEAKLPVVSLRGFGGNGVASPQLGAIFVYGR